MQLLLGLFLLGQAASKQTEYTLAYLLTVAMVLLGILLVCIPRPRKKDFVDPKNKNRKAPQKKKKK